MTGWIGIHTAVGLVADVFSSWLVPAFIFVVIVGICWLGLRWIRAEHLDELRSVPLFSGLSDRELLWVLRFAKPVSFEPGAVVIHEGDKGGDFFLITNGSAKVSADSADLATLGAGSYFGEMALIDGGSRTATVTAATAVSTLAISPTAFLRTVDREPMLGRGLYAELNRRLGESGERIEWDGMSPVDRAMLVDVCGRLRAQTEHPEWSPPTTPAKHRLFLTWLFARGD